MIPNMINKERLRTPFMVLNFGEFKIKGFKNYNVPVQIRDRTIFHDKIAANHLIGVRLNEILISL